MQCISENIYQIRNMIKDTCRSCGRDPEEVVLLCVSKTHPAEAVKEAYAAGERHFGESYALEAAAKITALKEEGFNDIVWHFIGPVQSNKTKHIAAHFDIVESVDRIKILDRLNEQRPEGMKPVEVLIQVNISEEDQKQGCDPSELQDLLSHAALLPNIRLRGLMGIAKADADEKELCASFNKLAALLAQYREKYPELHVLSMGMTHDAEIAVKCGSTELRIGTAIFGERNYAKA